MLIEVNDKQVNVINQICNLAFRAYGELNIQPLMNEIVNVFTPVADERLEEIKAQKAAEATEAQQQEQAQDATN